MSSQYSVAFTQLDAAVSQAEDQARQIKKALTDMDQEVRKTLSTWTGDAQDHYISTFNSAMAEADQLPVSLTMAHQALAGIGDVYKRTESLVAQTFS
ncbi:WXG100 family type VII secretion target [Pseudonocardia xinjiangensis]|jgi:WXG100 family type VII secretion target|uniref:ESAT-6-like protein n=1 Tax=Pseudonocardia xinjiangensis TaxID=75289 RepID=A0ABX1RND5_9PSEU|nr:WXG100 family type VII secretion target [Pseudonocardia xinjiangensis]NMH81898.1 WXG100 family type VII secretion target [Pseudonocardia xinjiangensis]